jgi:predicted MFS family arabinose efflux permease
LEQRNRFWHESLRILRTNRNFSVFLGVRSLSQFAGMASAFFIIYTVWHFEISEASAGLLTSIYLVAIIFASLFMGRLADRWSPRLVMSIGAMALALSALLARLAPSAAWFYPVVILASLGSVAVWTIPIPLTIRFGSEDERPFYIGLSNTVSAPATILAPVFGGWLADSAGFELTFLISAVCGLIMAVMLVVFVKDPPPQQVPVPQTLIHTPIE